MTASFRDGEDGVTEGRGETRRGKERVEGGCKDSKSLGTDKRRGYCGGRKGRIEAAQEILRAAR